MVFPFDAIADALARLLSISAELAGIFLGFIVIVSLCVLVTFVSRAYHGWGIIIPFGIGLAFVYMVGWFPVWTVIITALFGSLALFRPFSEGRSI